MHQTMTVLEDHTFRGNVSSKPESWICAVSLEDLHASVTSESCTNEEYVELNRKCLKTVFRRLWTLMHTTLLHEGQIEKPLP
jgi:hypothetical protein